MIEILEKGFLTLPVTSKRHAFASLGVPAGGPMDSFRYDLAKMLWLEIRQMHPLWKQR